MNGPNTIWADPKRCHAHSKRTGEQCQRYPAEGLTVCRWHGGHAPQVRAAAERRIITMEIEAEAETVLAHEGIEAIGDPLEELGKLAAEARAMTDALAQRVNALDAITGPDHNGDEKIAQTVILYERAMDRTAKLLDILVRAGFMERQVKIQEGTGDMVAMVLRRIFNRLELTPTQQVLVGSVVPEELRALEM